MRFIEKISNRHEFAGVEEYPFSIPAIRSLREMEFKSDVTFITGENGSGKSTLIEAIAVKAGFNAEGGTRNFNFSTRETHSDLYKELSITRGVHREKDGFFMRAESFYNVATEIDKLSDGIHQWYGGKSLHVQSHGESFLSVFLHRLRGDGLYIFDEPEAALSVKSMLTMMVRMRDLIRRNSQFIIATHSPVLLAFPGADIRVITENGWESVPFEQTEQYKITRYILSNHQLFFEGLFAEENQ